MSTFQDIIQLIENGQNVDENTINTILRVLDGNTKYVKELLETLNRGEAVFLRNKTVDSSVVVGNPVYWNAATSRFEKALAAATVGDDGNLTTAASAQVWGIIHHKHNSTSADILLHGFATLDISSAVSGSVTSGIYYLSAVTAGQLVKQQPAVSVSVLQSDGVGGVYVNPKFFDAFTDHKHYKFDLVCLPAGTHTPPSVDARHEITSADDEVEGWLPADDPSFGGNAPEGAAFGYNLAASSLNSAWPPLPIGSVYIEWDKGEDKDVMGIGVPLGPTGLCVVDNFGIWWMSDCYKDVPWPYDYDTSSPPVSSSESLECPRTLEMRMTLYFTRVTAQTNGNLVTSLVVDDDSADVLEVTCATDGTPASTGDLKIKFNQSLQVQGTTDTGSLAVKSLTGSVFSRGPVVARIKSNSPSLLVGGTTSGDYKYGDVTLTLLDSVLGAELPVSVVRLDGVSEENYEDTIGLGFAPNRDSSFRGMFKIPADLGSVTSVTLELRFKFLAMTTGSLPDMTLSYRKIPRPTPTVTTHTALPTSDTSLAISMAAGQTPNTITAGYYLEIKANTFTASPGDVVYYTLAREGAGGDGYSGEVHVIDQRPTITAAS